MNTKPVAQDASQRANREAQDRPYAISVGSSRERPSDGDEVAGRARSPGPCLSMPSDKSTCSRHGCRGG